MALEAVVYPQGPLSYYTTTNSFLRSDYGNYPFGLHLDEEEEEEPLKGYKVISVNNNNNNNRTGSCNGGWDHVQPNNTSSPDTTAPPDLADGQAASGGRRKRRRAKSAKNREEIENQRMTHIAVERNRRKQMNEYLAVLRSLMPQSYSQRGDQASIIGGAINFVKELEQLLQSMETQKIANDSHSCSNLINPQQPFLDFFSFPQYSTRSTAGLDGVASPTDAASADIEVTMVESHANLKIQSRKRPKQLLRLVAGLQVLRLCVLHLNVTTSGDMVLYSVSVKAEDGCHLTTVDEIAAAVNQMFQRIEEETAFS